MRVSLYDQPIISVTEALTYLMERDRLAYLQERYFSAMLERLWRAGSIGGSKPGDLFVVSPPSARHDGGEPVRPFKFNPQAHPNVVDTVTAVVQDTLKKLCMFDPTSNMSPDGAILKQPGGYSEWIIKQFISSPMKWERWIEDAYKIKEDLSYFFRLKAKLPPEARDINRIKSPEALYDLIKPFLKELKATKAQSTAGVTTLLHSGAVQMYIPTTFEASQHLGSNTRWCTAASSGERYFQQYSKDGPLFVVFVDRADNEHEEVDKYQLHFPTGQFMDSDDRAISLKADLLDHYPQVAEVLRDYFVREIEAGKDVKDNAKNLDTIGQSALLDPLVKSGKLTVDHLEHFPVLTIVGMMLRDTISVEQLRALVRDHSVWFERDVFYLVFADWSDASLLEFFDNDDSNRGRYSSRDRAEKLFDNSYFDNYDDSWVDASTALSIISDLDSENLHTLRELVASASGKTEAMTWDYTELRNELEDNEDGHDYEEIIDALRRAYGDADRNAREGAYYTGAIEELEAELGKHEFKNGQLAFLQKYDKLMQYAQAWDPDDHEGTVASDESIVELIRQSITPATLQEEYWHSVGSDDINEPATHHLGDVVISGPPDKKEPE